MYYEIFFSWNWKLWVCKGRTKKRYNAWCIINIEYWKLLGYPNILYTYYSLIVESVDGLDTCEKNPKVWKKVFRQFFHIGSWWVSVIGAKMGTDSYRDKENNVEIMSHIQSAVTSKGEILRLLKDSSNYILVCFLVQFFFNFEEFWWWTQINSIINLSKFCQRPN